MSAVRRHSARDLMAVVRRRAWLATKVFVVLSAAVIAAVFLYPPTFRSDAVVQLPTPADARHAISVLGGEAKSVTEKLNKDHGAIQSKVMKRVVLKSTPVLRFHHDSSAERGVEIVNLLEEVDKIPKAPEEDA